MSLPILGVFQQALLPIALIMTIGYLWRRWRPGGLDVLQVRAAINNMVLYATYPALAFHVVSGVRIDADIIWAPALEWLAIFAGLGLAAALFTPLLRRGTLTATGFGALLLGSSLTNLISLGIPVQQAALGEAAARYAIYADILGIAPLFWTLGIWVAIRFGSGDPALARPGNFLRMLLRLPPSWAFAAGILVNVLGIPVPAGIDEGARMLGYATMPCMLLTVGMSLSFASFRRYPGLVLAVSAIKLVAVPLIVLGAGAALLGMSETTVAMTLAAGMPTMMATIVLSERFGLDTELLATVMVGTTIAYFLTLPVWLRLLA